MVRPNTPALITPPADGSKVRPYAAIWPRIITIAIILGAGTSALQAISLLAPALLTSLSLLPTLIALSLFPILLWTIMSIVQERKAAQPRVPLLSISFTAFLTSYSIVLPLIDRLFAINQWLPLASAVDRILGYTFTVGISQAGFVYATVMLFSWRNHLRNRDDVVAYCMTVAIAYAAAENLYSLMQGLPLLDAAAIRFFSNLALSIASGLVLAYGLTQTRFDSASSLIMPFTLILSALLIGAVTPLQPGLTSATLSLEPTMPRPLLGLGLAAIVLVSGITITSWLLTSAENRAREVETVAFMDEF